MLEVIACAVVTTVIVTFGSMGYMKRNMEKNMTRIYYQHNQH